MLDESSLSLHEQYRYVATTERVDWTHEREWRWKYDETDLDDIPGIALWKLGEKPRPSQIIIVVKTEAEEEEILDLVKEHFDDEGNIHGYEYDVGLLLNTSVVSLDRISALDVEGKTIRLDDLQPKGLAKINLSDQIAIPDAEISKIISGASEAGRIEGERWRELMPRNSASGHIIDVCGFAYVVSHEANSPIINRMRKLGIIKLWMGTGYRVEIPGICGMGNQSLTVDEKAAEAAANYLTSRLGVKFYMTSRLD